MANTTTATTQQSQAATTATATTHQALNDSPPPPYTDADSDFEPDSEDSADLPHKITINAGHTIHGYNNLVPITISPATIATAAKMSAALLNAVARLNDAAADGSSKRLRLDLTINCGVTVTGGRNVIGQVGLKPKTATTPTDGRTAAGAEPVFEKDENAVAGAKRKADDEVSLIPIQR